MGILEVPAVLDILGVSRMLRVLGDCGGTGGSGPTLVSVLPIFGVKWQTLSKMTQTQNASKPKS